jgi:hypothetical protein
VPVASTVARRALRFIKRRGEAGMAIRIFNVLLGTWLFISTFMWPHAPVEAAFTMACGGLSVVFALATIYHRGFRYVNAAVAVLLFISTIILSSSAWRGPTMWHNAVVAIGLFVIALFDGSPETVSRERELYGRT